MQGIYNYVPETNHVSRLYSVAAVPYLQFMLHIMLFHTLNMFCAFMSALSAVRVRCPMWLVFVAPWICAFPVCCSGTVWFILRWFQLPPLLLVSLLLLHSICAQFLLQGLYVLEIFSVSFLITFLSPEFATYINIHVPFLLSWIMMFGLLLGMVLSVCTCGFHNMVTLPSQFVPTNNGTWSYQCPLSNFTPISLHMLKCS